jgi:hypothetical protein
MKIEKIFYQKTFPTAIQYANERLGVEVSLSEGDNAAQAFKEAKALVDEMHSQMNPRPSTNIGDEAIVPSDYNKGQVPVVDHKHLDEVEEKIMAATTMEQLMLLKHDTTTKRLRGVYLNKFNELSKL